MSSCSSASPASQPSIQQLLQKATNPTPQQSPKKLLTGHESGATPETQQQGLNTNGPRGTQLNITT
ncbi:MAG: hypothetical protein KGL10_05805 [Alphaproteobacteria bacterium]|nr:hypothetical protein [Alphaproteobacteria bacterium]MDE2336808.1 hypothetical protein [Alphaproteobacteria bacterium]